MSSGLIALVTVIYVGVSLSYWLKEGNPGMAVVFAGYAVANLGLIYVGWK